MYKQGLLILNCQQHTESADFLGSLRPVRKATVFQDIKKLFISLYEKADSPTISRPQIESSSDLVSDFQRFWNTFPLKQEHQTEYEQFEHLAKQSQSLFTWHDGPLIHAMKKGEFLLIDEISLADDSVLERMNSVLEPSRKLLLAEKSSTLIEEIRASPQFRVFATMNPGGDFGKKELSPAMRNRFTEIWVPDIDQETELVIT